MAGKSNVMKLQRPGPGRVVCFWLLLISAQWAGAGSAIHFVEPQPPLLEAAHPAAYLGIGQAVADVDRDGWPDLYLTSGQGPNRLLINQAGQRFAPGENAQPTELSDHESAGALFFDHDNDGWPDLLVLGRGGTYLFRNLAGQGWDDISAVSGIVTSGQGQSAAVADFDGDGWLDLYIVHWYFDDDESSPLKADQLFRNDQGVFEDVSYWLDDASRNGPGFAASWLDFNYDGRPDLYVVNDKLYGNVLLRNDGPGCGGWCFSDVSSATGADRPAFSMGIAVGDPDLDGDLDLFYSSIGEQVLLENLHVQNQPRFVERSALAGVSFDAIGWGAVFFDADNDGREDLYLVTSNIDPTRCNRFWQGDGSGLFIDRSDSSGLADCGFGMGLAVLDYDRDGLQDLVLGNWNERFMLYRNASLGGVWLRLRLDGGDRVNRDAIGTRVRLGDTLGRVQTRELRRGSGHGGNHEPVLHFGLGQARPEWLELRWPDGVIQRIETPTSGEWTLVHPHDGGMIFSDGLESRP
jgi:hypothetical protein